MYALHTLKFLLRFLDPAVMRADDLFSQKCGGPYSLELESSFELLLKRRSCHSVHALLDNVHTDDLEDLVLLRKW